MRTGTRSSGAYEGVGVGAGVALGRAVGEAVACGEAVGDGAGDAVADAVAVLVGRAAIVRGGRAGPLRSPAAIVNADATTSSTPQTLRTVRMGPFTLPPALLARAVRPPSDWRRARPPREPKADGSDSGRQAFSCL